KEVHHRTYLHTAPDQLTELRNVRDPEGQPELFRFIAADLKVLRQRVDEDPVHIEKDCFYRGRHIWTPFCAGRLSLLYIESAAHVSRVYLAALACSISSLQGAAQPVRSI